MAKSPNTNAKSDAAASTEQTSGEASNAEAAAAKVADAAAEDVSAEKPADQALSAEADAAAEAAAAKAAEVAEADKAAEAAEAKAEEVAKDKAAEAAKLDEAAKAAELAAAEKPADPAASQDPQPENTDAQQPHPAAASDEVFEDAPLEQQASAPKVASLEAANAVVFQATVHARDGLMHVIDEIEDHIKAAVAAGDRELEGALSHLKTLYADIAGTFGALKDNPTIAAVMSRDQNQGK